jgi:hypothetical protein
MMPLWFKRSTISTFIVTLIIMTTLSLFASRNPASVNSSQWFDAAKQAPSGLIAQVIRDNIKPNIPVDAGRMKIWKIQRSGQTHPLYLIDSRVADMANYPHANLLCGVSGCAFFAYRSDDNKKFQQAWSAYLNVNLPPGVALIEPDDELRNGLPGLKVNQMKGKQIQQLYLSFNGQTYEITQVLLLPQRYD